ncbi:MAG: cytochrome c biogenesis protein CcsA [Lentisphaeria bacterium]|nr:cytochrome c biogenesis protein CcsA [Lentisphaeria bacterium]
MSADILLATLACGIFAAVAVLAAFHARDPAPARGQDMGAIAVTGVLCLVASLVVRGLRTGRLPAVGGFEAACWYTVAVTLAFLWVGLRRRVLRTLSAVLFPCLTVVLALGLACAGGETPVDPRLRHPLVAVHVVAAFAGYGLFTLEGLLAAAYLLQDRCLKRKRFGGMAACLPPLEALDRVMKELIGPAVGLFTLSIGMGIVLSWVNRWGLAWAADPKVAATAATWVVYVVLFYLRWRAGQHGRGLAWVAVLGFCCVLLTFLGVHLVAESLHDFGFGFPQARTNGQRQAWPCARQGEAVLSGPACPFHRLETPRT